MARRTWAAILARPKTAALIAAIASSLILAALKAVGLTVDPTLVNDVATEVLQSL